MVEGSWGEGRVVGRGRVLKLVKGGGTYGKNTSLNDLSILNITSST